MLVMAYSSAWFLIALSARSRGSSNAVIQRSPISWMGAGFR